MNLNSAHIVGIGPIGWTRHFFSRGDANAVGLQVAFWSAIEQTWKGRLAWDNAPDLAIWELENQDLAESHFHPKKFRILI